LDYKKGVGPWTADTLGVSDSHFGTMVIIVAAFIVRYAQRLKQLSIKNGCCGHQVCVLLGTR